MYAAKTAALLSSHPCRSADNIHVDVCQSGLIGHSALVFSYFGQGALFMGIAGWHED